MGWGYGWAVLEGGAMAWGRGYGLGAGLGVR